MIAVTIFLSMDYSSHTIINNGDDYYARSNFRDVELISTLLFTDEDIEAVRALDNVSDVEGVYETAGVLVTETMENDIQVISMPSRINVPIVTDGRLPQAEGECCIEDTIMEYMGLHIGDQVTVTDTLGDPLELLYHDTFVITGSIYYADTACYEEYAPGNRSMIVLPSEFNTESIEDCYTNVFLKLSTTEGLSHFSNAYLDAMDRELPLIEALADEREGLRTGSIRTRYQSELADALAELNEASDGLNDARDRLDAGWDEYESGVAELDANEARLEAGRIALDAAQTELADAQTRLQAAGVEIAAGQSQLDQAASELLNGRLELERGENELLAASEELSQYEIQLNAGRTALEQAESELNSGRAQLQSGMDSIISGQSEIRIAIRDYLTDNFGPYVSGIDWTYETPEVNVDDPNFSAGDFALTNEISFSLYVSLRDNLESFLEGTGMPEEDIETVLDFADEYTGPYAEIAAGCSEWDTRHHEYIEGVNQYSASRAEYDAGVALYSEGLAQYNAARAELDAGWDTYNENLEKYNEGAAEFALRREEYQAGLDEYNRGLTEYNTNRQAYEDGLVAVEEGREQLEEARLELTSGEEEYNEGLEEYLDGEARYREATLALRRLDICRWVVFDARKNTSFNILWRTCHNLKDIDSTFSVVFIIIAALVIFATLAKIIDEQRKLVGTTKSLGLKNGEILTKYLGFGVSGTFIGSLLGVFFGETLVQRIIMSAYGNNYIYGAGEYAFDVPVTVITVIVACILSGLTIWFSCQVLLKTTALDLLQEKAPAVRMKEPKKSGIKGLLYSRLLIYNMLNDKPRVIATIISVAGCCTLLVIGFTIQMSARHCVDYQYDRYEHFDRKVSFDTKINEDAEDEIMSALGSYGITGFPASDDYRLTEIGAKTIFAEVICGDLNNIDAYYTMRDADTGEKFNYDQTGIYITQQLSEYYDVGVGDTIYVFGDNMEPFPYTINGVFSNHIGYYMFLTEESYEAVTGEPPHHNAVYAMVNEGDKAAVDAALQEVSGVRDIYRREELLASIEELFDPLDSLVMICILGSALLAYFILLNLVTMLINQKKRELTVMRINGFTFMQVVKYIARELAASVVIGIILGLVSGAGIASHIIKLVESDQMRVDRDIQWTGLIYSALITFFFCSVICAFLFRKIKDLDLTDLTS